jgi:hypothetical protein
MKWDGVRVFQDFSIVNGFRGKRVDADFLVIGGKIIILSRILHVALARIVETWKRWVRTFFKNMEDIKFCVVRLKMHTIAFRQEESL